ncbi:tyrosine-protein kinase family protein [Egicoccus halophilus]|uniref:CobQ/CobB/MinD/ParA nucleotide binding domain-containing protein n=1 Tax=Egicoccus halophilus TaxID=1670830 RepID=A0A8J3AE54_9ACTN|nr:polysaccharide biosynthesis tyrosine autokinase [Egicoccus halophilus]GGI05346.1 hypothetical protein GCM10011354_13640 [Egicoccus halophilus]
MTVDAPIIRFVLALRRWWTVVAGLVVVALVGTWLTLPAHAPQADVEPGVNYTATHLLLSENPTVETGNLDLVVLLAQQGEVRTRVTGALGDGFPVGTAESVSIAPNKELGTLELTTVQPTADQAALVVNTYAEVLREFFDGRAAAGVQRDFDAAVERLLAFGERIRGLEDEINGLTESSIERRLLEAELDVLVEQYGLLQAEVQSLNARTIGDNPTFTTLQEPVPTPIATGQLFSMPTNRGFRFVLALFAALFAGLGAVFAIDWLDSRLRTRQDVEDAYGLPVIAELPRMRRREVHQDPLPALTRPGSRAAEVYRSLQLTLALALRWQLDRSTPTGSAAVGSAERIEGSGPPRTLLVTSARAGEGKSTIVGNLAASFAETGQRVLVVDCDFRRSAVADLLGAEKGPSLRDYADPRFDGLQGLIVSSAVPRVTTVRAGTPGVAPVWFFSRCADLVAEAREHADIVVFDAGPLLATNEAAALVPHVDSVLVVTCSGRLAASLARRALETLTQLKATVAGIVLLGGDDSPRRYGHYYEPLRKAAATQALDDVTPAERV